jgi:hypothetical protein
MAKGQHLSNYQRGIVNRYYQHLDTIAVQKLGEAVGELYLCMGDNKKSDKLWKGVEKALEKTAASDAQVGKILAARDVEGLARLVNSMGNPRG